jgi:capsular exopolysaccharide synthesis family protein
MELKWIWEVLYRRKWLVIETVLVITVSALLGSLLMKPAYQATSNILLKKVKKGVSQEGRELIGLPGLSSMIIRTHADVNVNRVLATTRGYMEDMINKLQLRDDSGDFYKTSKMIQTGVISTIRSKIFPKPGISITQYQTTDILQVKATSPNPQEAMMMAKALSQIMIEKNQELIREEYATARRFLESQMDRVKGRFTESLSGFTDFQKREATVDLATESKLAAQKLSELVTQREKDIIELAQSHGRLAELQTQLAKQTPDFLYATTMQDSPQIAFLSKKIAELEIQRTQATSELTDRHPRVQAVKEQLKQAKAELKKEIDVYRESAPQLIAIGRQIAAVEAHLQGVQKDIDSYLETLGGIPDKVFKKETLGMELNVTQQIYRSLLDSWYEIGMGEASTLSEIAVVQEAVVPSSPYSPNVHLNVVLAAFLGLIMGVGVAFAFEYWDDTIRVEEDMKEFKPFDVIGTVPAFEPQRTPSITAKDPNDPLFESYRKLRNGLTAFHPPVKSLLITSPGPGEGKSTTLANLGVSFAREGKQVIILDMDLRRPTVHSFFELPNEKGVTDLLQNRMSIGEAVQSTGMQGLSVIAAGLPLPDPGRLVESSHVADIISDLKRQFDVVILDSAPLLVKCDALVLARAVDGLVIVVESEKTTRRAVYTLMEILARLGIKPLGFVLNGVAAKQGKDFYKQFYYGYYGKGVSTIETTR